MNNPLMFRDPYGEDVWVGWTGQANAAFSPSTSGLGGGVIWGGGFFLNISTGEFCMATIRGWKIGTFVDMSISGELIIIPSGPECGYNLGGSSGFFEVGWPISGLVGKGGSLSFGSSLGIGGGGGVGITYWIGAGVEVVDVIWCSKNDCECKPKKQ